MRTGEAYGECIGAASQRLDFGMRDLDSILDEAIKTCGKQGRRARKAYRLYLKSIGIDATPEDVERVFADGRPRLRQRIAGCLDAARATREDGVRRTC